MYSSIRPSNDSTPNSTSQPQPSLGELRTPQSGESEELRTPQPGESEELRTPQPGESEELRTPQPGESEELRTPQPGESEELRTPQPGESEELRTPQPGELEELRTPQPGELEELRTQEVREIAEEITQNYIERISTRDPSEDEATYRLRIRYTQAILNLPLRDNQGITLEEAISLGFMVMKKTRYGITYSAPVEKRIQVINQLLLDTLGRSQTPLSTEPQTPTMPESQTP